MELQLHGGGGGGGGNHSDSVQHHSTRNTTFSLPLTRFTTRLIDCGDHRSDAGEDPIISADNCYSRPIVILDLIWNLAFVMVSVLVLFSSIPERPSTPLRLWVSGYALQCLLHVAFVFLEYRTKISAQDRVAAHGLSSSQGHNGIVKRLESINTVISSVWWVIGFYWIVVGGQALLQDSPRLYWLTVIFLAFDVFFIFFCIGMACVIFFALFCCIPIVAIAYAVATRQGASEDDIRNLPRYRYRQASSVRTLDNNKKQEVSGTRVDSGDSTSTSELALHLEDSECCICLSRYVDGAELYTLPCNHHFHGGCISKWLRINATCPLCKFNIRRGDTLV